MNDSWNKISKDVVDIILGYDPGYQLGTVVCSVIQNCPMDLLIKSEFLVQLNILMDSILVINETDTLEHNNNVNEIRSIYDMIKENLNFLPIQTTLSFRNSCLFYDLSLKKKEEFKYTNKKRSRENENSFILKKWYNFIMGQFSSISSIVMTRELIKIALIFVKNVYLIWQSLRKNTFLPDDYGNYLMKVGRDLVRIQTLVGV